MQLPWLEIVVERGRRRCRNQRSAQSGDGGSVWLRPMILVMMTMMTDNTQPHHFTVTLSRSCRSSSWFRCKETVAILEVLAAFCVLNVVVRLRVCVGLCWLVL